jgi:hypothetical protein
MCMRHAVDCSHCAHCAHCAHTAHTARTAHTAHPAHATTQTTHAARTAHTARTTSSPVAVTHPAGVFAYKLFCLEFGWDPVPEVNLSHLIFRFQFEPWQERKSFRNKLRASPAKATMDIVVLVNNFNANHFLFWKSIIKSPLSSVSVGVRSPEANSMSSHKNKNYFASSLGFSGGRWA